MFHHWLGIYYGPPPTNYEHIQLEREQTLTFELKLGTYQYQNHLAFGMFIGLLRMQIHWNFRHRGWYCNLQKVVQKGKNIRYTPIYNISY